MQVEMSEETHHEKDAGELSFSPKQLAMIDRLISARVAALGTPTSSGGDLSRPSTSVISPATSGKFMA